MKLYQAIAKNAAVIGKPVFAAEATRRAKRIKDTLPSGSGFDNGTEIVSVTPRKIVLRTSFHHMNEMGMYCGWSNHDIVVHANMVSEFDLVITGRNVRDIKEVIADTFATLLHQEFEWHVFVKTVSIGKWHVWMGEGPCVTLSDEETKELKSFDSVTDCINYLYTLNPAAGRKLYDHWKS